MYVRDRRRAQDAAVAALQVELSCMNKENQHLRGCSRCHAGHHQLPGAPDYRGELCAALMGEEEKRDGAALMLKENGVKWSIQLN